MRYVNFNKTDLQVSALCLGTSGFGTNVPESVSFEQMDLFRELGGTFMDTARVYGDWDPSNPGASEKTIGKWMAARGCREKTVISTKGGHPILGVWHISRCTPDQLEQDLSESLDHLQTEYIDLYFLHRDNLSLPVGTLIDWLENQRVKGRIRWYGLSNWTLARIQEAMAYAQAQGAEGLVCNQVQASLAAANPEALKMADMVALDPEMAAMHEASGLNLMAYMSMAGGYLARRLAGREIPGMQQGNFGNPVSDAVAEWLKAHVTADYSVADFSMAFFKTLPFTAVPIASCSSLDQMRGTVAAIEKDIPKALTDELMALRYAG